MTGNKTTDATTDQSPDSSGGSSKPTSSDSASSTGTIGPQGAAAELLEDLDELGGDRDDGARGEPEPEPSIDWSPILEQAFGITLEFAAKRDPIWASSEGEVRALAAAWSPVCDKYLGGVSVEGAAIAVTVAWALPRVAQVIQTKATAKRAARRRRPVRDRDTTYVGRDDDDQVDDVPEEPADPSTIASGFQDLEAEQRAWDRLEAEAEDATFRELNG